MRSKKVHGFHRLTDSWNDLGWKGPLQVILSTVRGNKREFLLFLKASGVNFAGPIL